MSTALPSWVGMSLLWCEQSVAVGLKASFGGGTATSPSLVGRAVLPLAQHSSGAMLSFSMERDRHSQHRELFLLLPIGSTTIFVACFSP